LRRRDGHDRIEHQRGDERAVLAAAEADEPGSGVVEVKPAQGVLDLFAGNPSASAWG
jgi:hypothetical protein